MNQIQGVMGVIEAIPTTCNANCMWGPEGVFRLQNWRVFGLLRTSNSRDKYFMKIIVHLPRRCITKTCELGGPPALFGMIEFDAQVT